MKILFLFGSPSELQKKLNAPFIGESKSLMEHIFKIYNLDLKDIDYLYIEEEPKKLKTADLENYQDEIFKIIEELNPDKILCFGSFPMALVNNWSTLPSLYSTQGLGTEIKINGKSVFTVCIQEPFIAVKEPDTYEDFRLAITKFLENSKPFPREEINFELPFLEANVDDNKALSYITEVFSILDKLKILVKDKSIQVISADLETTGLDFRTDTLEAIGLAWYYSDEEFNPNQVHSNCLVIPYQLVYHPDIVQSLRNLFFNPELTFVFHNSKFDLKFLKEYFGEFPTAQIEDTMFISYVIDSRNTGFRSKPHGLKSVARKYYDVQDYKFDFKEFWKKEPKDRDWNDYYYYLGQDISYTLHFYYLNKLHKNKRFYNELLLPANKILTDMEHRGIYLDVPYLKALEEEFNSNLEKLVWDEMARLIIKYSKLRYEYLENKGTEELVTDNYIPNGLYWSIYSELEEKLNLNSYKQVKIILSRILKYEQGILVKWDKVGSDKNSLKDYILDFEDSDLAEFSKLLLEYRKESKLLSTYVKSWLNKQENSILHPDFDLNGTITGRISCREPNVQQIPRVGEFDLRKAIVAPENMVICKIDYSQLEVRIAAWYSQDKNMIEALNTTDFHRHMASKLFDKLPEDITKQERFEAKAVVFGILYGSSAKGITENPVLKASGMTIKKAQALIDKLFNDFTGLANWIESIHADVLENNSVSTPMERTREWQLITKGNKKSVLRAAVNTPIQSLASDITLNSLIQIDKFLKENNHQTKPILIIHDEIDFLVPLTNFYEIDNVIPRIVDIMINETPIDLGSVPLEVEPEIGFNWSELYSIEEFKEKFGEQILCVT